MQFSLGAAVPADRLKRNFVEGRKYSCNFDALRLMISK